MGEIHDLQRHELMKRVYWYEKKFGPYIEKKGKHNWKNLFRKPTLHEWIILIMLTMSLFLWWAYNQDMESCREIIMECNAYLNPTFAPLNYSNGSWWNVTDQLIITNMSGGT